MCMKCSCHQNVLKWPKRGDYKHMFNITKLKPTGDRAKNETLYTDPEFAGWRCTCLLHSGVGGDKCTRTQLSRQARMRCNPFQVQLTHIHMAFAHAFFVEIQLQEFKTFDWQLDVFDFGI